MLFTSTRKRPRRPRLGKLRNFFLKPEFQNNTLLVIYKSMVWNIRTFHLCQKKFVCIFKTIFATGLIKLVYDPLASRQCSHICTICSPKKKNTIEKIQIENGWQEISSGQFWRVQLLLFLFRGIESYTFFPAIFQHGLLFFSFKLFNFYMNKKYVYALKNY